MDHPWIATAFAAARPAAIAALHRCFGDMDLAEEAFQEACLKALRKWPESGPPRDPAAWLILVGRNSGIDGIRKRGREDALPEEIAIAPEEDAEAALAERIDRSDYGDDLLRLLFICCHRDLPATQQIAIALRIVCGLSVEQIAAAFLVKPAAMEQRITRAKRVVGKADVAFDAPGPVQRTERLHSVLSMLYLMFNQSYSAPSDAAPAAEPLCLESIRLARMLHDMFPDEPEAIGLLALLLLHHSRAPARFDALGEPVLLDAQDRGLWDRGPIAEGHRLVAHAFGMRRPGPFQLQAAIAALHCRSPSDDETDWPQIAQLYAVLEEMSPTPVVRLNRAIAIAKAQGPQPALELVEPLAEALDAYFHFHGTRGWLLARLGRKEEARDAFNRAIALARQPAEAVQIRRYLDGLDEG